MNSHEPAFSISEIRTDSGIKSGYKGLTKREYFAAMAMQGLLANSLRGPAPTSSVAIAALTYADELLKQLEK